MSFLLLTLLLALGGIYSVTFIEVGQQFVLGGQQRGAFWVKARNCGPVPGSVAARRAEAALFRTLGKRAAKMGFVVSGDVSVSRSMTCEGLKK